jgi:hypothetical protein
VIFADGATCAANPRDIAFANTARVPLKGAFSGGAGLCRRAKIGPSYRTMNRRKWMLALALLALALFMYASIIWKMS